MMVKKFFAILAILSITLFAQEQKVDKFEIKDIFGKTTTIIGKKNGLEIPSAKGKIVLIEFWGTHCPPCMFSISHYIELNKKYKDKIAMFAVEVQATPKEQLIDFVKSKGINYNIYTQQDNSDFVKYVAIRAKWSGAIPFLIILDETGSVIDIKTGMVPKEYIEKLIEYLEKNKTKQKRDTNSTKADSNSTK
jgi:thiol-disulfide isomerase/thioredoxin